MNLTELTWPQVDALDRRTPIVFPIAALEQHGRHMPLFTDSLLLGEIVRRTAGVVAGEQILFAPLQWLGNSHHHLDMPGTLSASPRGYLQLLHDLTECVVRHGFQRVVFINGHGGNTGPSQQALFELRQQHRERRDLLLLSLTYWDAVDTSQLGSEFVQTNMGHACEWETSMMLALRPELVQGDVAQIAEVPFGVGGLPGYRGWTMADRSLPGHIGAPSAASAGKGERLFELFAEGVARFLARVIRWDGTSWDLSPEHA